MIMRVVLYLVIGFIFGLGISISGMGNPAKVLNFFDIAGTWDASLAFVMGGALLVTTVGYRLAFKQARPIFADVFHLPTKGTIDRKLILGSATFGLGWGIAGFCPGASLPMVGTVNSDVLVFVGAMIGGIILATLGQRASK